GHDRRGHLASSAHRALRRPRPARRDAEEAAREAHRGARDTRGRRGMTTAHPRWRTACIPVVACAGWLLASCAATPPRPSEPAAPAQTPPPVAAPAPAPAPTPKPLRPIDVAAVGDIMLGTTYPEDDYDRLPPDDAAGTFADTASILRAADIAFGNLE